VLPDTEKLNDEFTALRELRFTLPKLISESGYAWTPEPLLG
jgi:hypothetical protein